MIIPFQNPHKKKKNLGTQMQKIFGDENHFEKFSPKKHAVK